MPLRLLTVDDIPQGMRLKELAGWNQTEADWRRFLSMEPDGCFAAEEEGRVVGTSAATVFGPVGWIAMVLVDPAFRHRGLGTQLVRRAMEYLEGRGVRSMRLDATALGRPVYERLGFRPEYELGRWERISQVGVPALAGGPAGTRPEGGVPTGACATACPPPPSLQGLRDTDPAAGKQCHTPTGVAAVTHVAADQLAEIARLDAQFTGTCRLRLLERLHFAQPDAMRAVGAAGRPVAYLAWRPGSRTIQIGPGAAMEAEDGLVLADAALGACSGRPVFVDIPVDHGPASRWAASRGLSVQRRFLRMCRGDPVVDQPDCLWASSGPENG